MTCDTAEQHPHDAGPRLRWASWFGLLGVWVGSISTIHRVSPDLYHEMAWFREALQTRSVPIEDVFAYTPTVSPCVHHEWGAGAVFYVLSMSLGGTGLTLLKYAGACAVAAGCWLLAKRRGSSDAVLSLLAPLAILCGCIGFLSVRAQLFTLCGTVGLLHLLEQDRQGGRRWILIWIPVYVVWINLHAGFLVGAGLYGIYALGRWVEAYRHHRAIGAATRATRHLWAVAAAMAVLLGVNPYGWQYGPYLWHAVRMDRPFIAEWQPLWHFPRLLVPYAITWLPLGYVLCRHARQRSGELLMILVPALLACQHVRHLSIYAVVWISYVPPLLAETTAGRAIGLFSCKHARWLCGLWIGLGVLGIAQAAHNRCWDLRLPLTRAEDPSLQYPAGAVEYLRAAAFKGHAMVPFEAGAFVSWKLHPAVKVSCDGRYEVAFPPDQVRELWDLYATARAWQQVLRRYPPDVVLVPRSSPLEARLEPLQAAGADAPWQRVYRDDGYAIYARRDLAPRLPPCDRSGQPIAAAFP